MCRISRRVATSGIKTIKSSEYGMPEILVLPFFRDFAKISFSPARFCATLTNWAIEVSMGFRLQALSQRLPFVSQFFSRYPRTHNRHAY
jgi:hypothetical protein